MQEYTSAFIYEVSDKIATITLNRPEKLNTQSRDTAKELIGLFDLVDKDDNVSVVIVTGAGRAFCAGADLTAKDSSFANVTPEAAVDDTFDWSDPATRDYGGFITLRIFECLKPVIFAVNGAAAGMGVSMMLAGDIRLASTTAKFALPFARRGICPESTVSWFLPRVVGIGKALEWLLSGRTFSVQEALDAQLVRSVHAPEELLPAAIALAREIADNTAPVSVALTRQMLWRMLGADHPMEAHRIESRGVYTRARASDVREGVSGFLEKRAPHFTDRVSTDMPRFYPWWDERSYG